MKITKAMAKKMAKELEDYGWCIDSDSRECKKCETISFHGEDNFCGKCGEKLPKLNKSRGINEIFQALQHTFEGKK